MDFDKAYPELAEGRPATSSRPSARSISSGNLVGYPAISLPNGFGREGLPTGFQLLASPFREDVLTTVGAGYQRRTDFHRRKPLSG